MTAAERLKLLSGLAGVSAATMLLTLGSGATAGAILTDYSGLSSATATQHFLTDSQPANNYIAAHVTADTSSAASLQAYIRFSALTSSDSTAAAQLQGKAPLAAFVSLNTTADGALYSQIRFAADSTLSAEAAGDLQAQIKLLADALTSAAANGQLKGWTGTELRDLFAAQAVARRAYVVEYVEVVAAPLHTVTGLSPINAFVEVESSVIRLPYVVPPQRKDVAVLKATALPSASVLTVSNELSVTI